MENLNLYLDTARIQAERQSLSRVLCKFDHTWHANDSFKSLREIAGPALTTRFVFESLNTRFTPLLTRETCIALS